MVTSIAIVNKTTVLKADVVSKFARAVDVQLRRDFTPRWGQHAVAYYAPTDALPANVWKVYLRDEPRPGDAGAYGLHEESGRDHVPVAHVFVKLIQRSRESWTEVASHEVLEMLGDEWVNLTVMRELAGGVVELWPRELCDAVQGQRYVVEGVDLANFVLPEYFIEASDGPYDHLGRLRAPFSIAPTGYSSVMRLAPKSAPAWRDVYGVKAPAYTRANPASRRAFRKAHAPFKVR